MSWHAVSLLSEHLQLVDTHGSSGLSFPWPAPRHSSLVRIVVARSGMQCFRPPVVATKLWADVSLCLELSQGAEALLAAALAPGTLLAGQFAPLTKSLAWFGSLLPPGCDYLAKGQLLSRLEV